MDKIHLSFKDKNLCYRDVLEKSVEEATAPVKRVDMNQWLYAISPSVGRDPEDEFRAAHNRTVVIKKHRSNATTGPQSVDR